MSKRGGGGGDQFVKLKLVNPPKLTAKEKELYARLAAASHFDARELLRAR
jgi:DnaJ-class molecular chaperone